MRENMERASPVDLTSVKIKFKYYIWLRMVYTY